MIDLPELAYWRKPYFPPRLLHYWGDGPWIKEPWMVEWEHAGYPCTIVRGLIAGAWNGYVAISRRHPFYGLDMMDVELAVHGDLTYSQPHGDGWAFGFDCAHFMDFAPAMEARMNGMGLSMTSLEREAMLDAMGAFAPVYRPRSFVQGETEQLARQLRSIEDRWYDPHRGRYDRAMILSLTSDPRVEAHGR